MHSIAYITYVLLYWTVLPQFDTHEFKIDVTRDIPPIWRVTLQYMTYLALKWRHSSVVLQQADQSSVWEKRTSSRRQSSLLSSQMTNSHPPSLQLLWNNSQPPGLLRRNPLFLFSVAPIFFSFFLLCLTPAHRSTPPEMWLDYEDPLPAVTCLLRASENRTSSSSTPNFLDVHLPFSNVGDDALSFQRRGCQLHALFLLSAPYIFVFTAGGDMKDFREGKVWGYLCRFPAHLSSCTRDPLSV